MRCTFFLFWARTLGLGEDWFGLLRSPDTQSTSRLAIRWLHLLSHLVAVRREIVRTHSSTYSSRFLLTTRSMLTTPHFRNIFFNVPQKLWPDAVQRDGGMGCGRPQQQQLARVAEPSHSLVRAIIRT